jgi:hypothetical protein
VKSNTSHPPRKRASCLTVLTLSVATAACGPRFVPNPDSDSDSAGTSGGGASGSAGRAMVSASGGESAADAPAAAGGVSRGGVAGATPTSGGTSAGTSDLGGGASAGSDSTAPAGMAGIGGNFGAGGAAGAGGSAPVAGASGNPGHCMPALLIDDMEDGNDRNCPNQQRSGEWWTSTGTLTGEIDPPKVGNFPAFPLGADARPQSSYGMHLSGTGFGHAEADWASLGFNLIDDAAYDLTSFTGLAFYAKSKSTSVALHVEFATDATTSTLEGGACADDCNDHFEKVITIDGTWREYSVTFASLKQEGWGVKPKDLAHARFVFFGFLGTDGGPAAFEFLIDDVRLW